MHDYTCRLPLHSCRLSRCKFCRQMSHNGFGQTPRDPNLIPWRPGVVGWSIDMKALQARRETDEVQSQVSNGVQVLKSLWVPVYVCIRLSIRGQQAQSSNPEAFVSYDVTHRINF
jgi:hypothetical protein